MRHTSSHRLVMPLTTSGVLMAAYLLLRPYGDQAGGAAQAAEAMASPWWVVAHVCGMLALVQFARAALRLSDLTDGLASLVTRWSGLAGVVLVLPYYGAETFALHVIARRYDATGDDSLLPLIDLVREQPVAMTMFGLGLLLLAVSGVSFALAWQGSEFGVRLGRGRWAAWPLGLLVAVFLPQFYLPAAGRMAYGVVFFAAAVGLALAARRASSMEG